MLTDYALAVLALVLGVLLVRHAVASDGRAQGAWAAAFATTAAGAVTGGTWHGFADFMEARVRRGLWKATQLLLGLTGLAMVAGAALAVARGSLLAVLLAAAAAKFAVYARVVASRDDFGVVVKDYGASMAAVAVMQTISLLLWRAPAAPWILAGIGVALAGSLVQARRMSPHPRFNHNDLFHLVQMAAIWLFYRGGLLLADR